MMQCVATMLIVLCGFLMFSHAKENLCPGGKANCPDDSTCCVLSNGSFGCCPIQNAVCCKDSVHCCPDGYTCDVIEGTCKTGRKLVPLLKKFNSKPTMVPATTKRADGTITPEKKYQCSKESTCSKRSSGAYGCCPLKNAACCDDHKHCCPEGYTCDVDAGKCQKTAEHTNMIENIPAIHMSIAGEYIKGLQTKNMFQKISALKTKVSAALNVQIVECPDGRHHCAPFQTCCQVGPMSYKCCPMPSAVCCADAVHCCPEGFICDIMGRRCFPDKSKKRSEQINMIGEIQALKTSKDKCSKTDEHINTIENIPAIKTAIAGECNRGVQTKSILEKIPASKKKISAALGQIRPPPPVVCFDGSHCPFGQTCCPGPPGHGWRCCPHSPGNCCGDGVHCCPAGYLCVDAMRWICVRPLKENK